MLALDDDVCVPLELLVDVLLSSELPHAEKTRAAMIAAMAVTRFMRFPSSC